MSEAAAVAAPTNDQAGSAAAAPSQTSALASGSVSSKGDSGTVANDNGGKDAQSDWRAMFTEGLDEPMQKQWNSYAQRYQSPAEFAKSTIELRNNAIFVPKADDKPDAWDKVYDRLGRPKEPTEYKWNHIKDAPPLDEAEQEVRNGFGPVAHRAGLNQKQIDAVIQWHDQQRKVQTDAGVARSNTTTDTNIKTLKSEWGPDFDRNVANHSRALKHYAGADFDKVASMRLSDGTFVADNPVFVRMMSKIGAERSEDDRFAESFNPSSVADAKSQIQKIEQDAIAKGLSPVSQGWPHAELDALYKRAHSSKPMSPGNQFFR